jgi:hypothetical protein
LCSYSRDRAEIQERLRSAANVVVDAVVKRLRLYALEHALEPLAVPDMTRKFTVVSDMENTMD